MRGFIFERENYACVFLNERTPMIIIETNVPTEISGTIQIEKNRIVFMIKPRAATVLKKATKVRGKTKDTIPARSSRLMIVRKKLLSFLLKISKAVYERIKKTGVIIARYAMSVVDLSTLYRLERADDTKIDKIVTIIKRFLIFAQTFCP